LVTLFLAIFVCGGNFAYPNPGLAAPTKLFAFREGHYAASPQSKRCINETFRVFGGDIPKKMVLFIHGLINLEQKC
jgi:hypothetical protein